MVARPDTHAPAILAPEGQSAEPATLPDHQGEETTDHSSDNFEDEERTSDMEMTTYRHHIDAEEKHGKCVPGEGIMGQRAAVTQSSKHTMYGKDLP